MGRDEITNKRNSSPGPRLVRLESHLEPPGGVDHIQSSQIPLVPVPERDDSNDNLRNLSPPPEKGLPTDCSLGIKQSVEIFKEISVWRPV